MRTAASKIVGSRCGCDRRQLVSPLLPRRSGDANVLGANDRAHLHGSANDPGVNDSTLNPGRNLARNRNRDDGNRNHLLEFKIPIFIFRASALQFAIQILERVPILLLGN
jgi:hypothetical protein